MPQFNWQMSPGPIIGHSEFETFMKSGQTQMQYKNFTCLNDARKFCTTYGGKRLRGCSTQMTEHGFGKKAYVNIVKTNELFEEKMHEYQKLQKKRDILKELTAQKTLGENVDEKLAYFKDKKEFPYNFW